MVKMQERQLFPAHIFKDVTVKHRQEIGTISFTLQEIWQPGITRRQPSEQSQTIIAKRKSMNTKWGNRSGWMKEIFSAKTEN